MYTIKEAAARAGVTVPVLRAWERRYGVVQPTRTASGYRVYDDAAIGRVRAMRRLVNEGWAPNAAAGRVRAATDDEVAALMPPEPVRPRDAEASGPGDLTQRFVSAAAALDPRAVETVLDEMFAVGSFEIAVERHVLPALEALGAAWAEGRVDVAGEHAASHAVLRRLSAAYQAAGRPPSHAGAVLVGLPPGARHELGALAFSVVARRAGLPILYLGPDVPVRNWIEAARTTRAPAVVIGVVTAADRDAARDITLALLDADPRTLVALGGDGAVGPDGAVLDGDLDGDDRVILLPNGVVDAANRLVGALARAGRSGLPTE